jgi:hypothetical protein
MCDTSGIITQVAYIETEIRSFDPKMPDVMNRLGTGFLTDFFLRLVNL